MTDTIQHYGTPRHSGRYPWGSGKDPYQSSIGFVSYIRDMQSKGFSEKEIASSVGLSVRDMRAQKTAALNRVRKEEIAEIRRLRDKQYSNQAIADRLGISEASVRYKMSKADAYTKSKHDQLVNVLKEELDNNGHLDVGKGTEHLLGVTDTQLDAALADLKEDGYRVDRVKIGQLTTGYDTTMLVLSKPGTGYKEVVESVYSDQVSPPGVFTEEKGGKPRKFREPVSVDPKRIAVNYAGEGGEKADGVIYIRRGTLDADLGQSHYAQVRIKVGEDKYMKGMAMYNDDYDFPKGVDFVFNTSKKNTGNKMDALKTVENSKELPFKTIVRQSYYKDRDGKSKQSVLNIVGGKEGQNVEGSWDTWSRTIASQMLSKQNVSVAKRQLDLTYKMKKTELEDIEKITNPAIKRHLLMQFASDADASAVDLKAHAFPRQNARVILPISSLKDNEIYAPGYKNGESVVLIRYPHGGIFEIPRLKVNNNSKAARKILGAAKDAVGINHNVASILSGADFDGDTVVVIPDNKGRIKNSKPLKGLKDFDPNIYFDPSLKKDRLSKPQVESLMGSVSNLITDMTIKGAPPSKIERAVKHSMVVIDANKHQLDYKQSELDNGIAQLKAEFQSNGKGRGASTLISRASGVMRVDERKPRAYKNGGPINTLTGALEWEATGRTYEKWDPKTDKTKKVKALTKTTKMAEAKNALSLSSGTPMEKVYGDYANSMKALANRARKESLAVPRMHIDPKAKARYSRERETLASKIRLAERNAPLERKATVIAQTQMKNIMANVSSGDLGDDKKRKLGSKLLAQARMAVGAKKPTVKIDDNEWEAIQSGAVGEDFMRSLLSNADVDDLRKRATPRYAKGLTPGQIARARSMLALGYPQAEVAETIGVSSSSLSKALS